MPQVNDFIVVSCKKGEQAVICWVESSYFIVIPVFYGVEKLEELNSNVDAMNLRLNRIVMCESVDLIGFSFEIR